jgi:hypothetical protein
LFDKKVKTSCKDFFPSAGHDYYVKLVGRLVQSLQGKMPFPFMDWRFNEFPNEGAHGLYSTCIEVMGLPVTDCAQVRAEFVKSPVK